MDFRNASVPLDKVTSFEVNKTIQRSLTKAIARHGLGLYIYAGEDLFLEESDGKTPPAFPQGLFNSILSAEKTSDGTTQELGIEVDKDTIGGHHRRKDRR